MSRIIHGVTGDFELSTPELFVDNKGRGRSGHMTHAMIEYSPGKVMDFNSNCSPIRLGGHSAYGWVEYRWSEDGGETWGEVKTLDYSWKSFLDGLFTISVEKVVKTDDGAIVAFCLRNLPYREVCCEPWLVPTVIRSYDMGETWTEPEELGSFGGRVYDAVARGNSIWALEYCNDAEVTFTGNKPEHLYHVFRSDDGGKTFRDLGALPIEWKGRGYGSMLFRPDGSLVVYAYNVNDERHMDTAISYDEGETWEVLEPGYVALGIRNPQTGIVDGTYVLHGRGANHKSFVLYTSKDGLTWDAGHLLEPDKRCCYYSNNLLLHDKEGRERLLIQYSDTFEASRVNVMHMWMQRVKP